VSREQPLASVGDTLAELQRDLRRQSSLGKEERKEESFEEEKEREGEEEGRENAPSRSTRTWVVHSRGP